jgi:hypothetical protein
MIKEDTELHLNFANTAVSEETASHLGKYKKNNRKII